MWNGGAFLAFQIIRKHSSPTFNTTTHHHDIIVSMVAEGERQK
jgi:hypothetical protein